MKIQKYLVRVLFCALFLSFFFAPVFQNLKDLQRPLVQGEAPVVMITSPLNITYSASTIPIYAANTTNVHSAWWRFSDGIWSDNYTLTWDQTDTRWESGDITWFADNYHIQVFFNNSDNEVGYADEWFTVNFTFGAMLDNFTYGGSNSDQAYSLIQTTDGGYMLAGYTNSIGAGNVDAWLVKIQPNGTTEWNQTYGDIYYEDARDVIQTIDEGYAFLGSKEPVGGGDWEYWLVKTDYNGVEEWNQTYGGALGYSVIQTADDGYAIIGEASGPIGKTFLVKVNEFGVEEWNQTYSNYHVATSLLQTADGGYVLAGREPESSPDTNNFWLAKTDSEGLIEWEQDYGGLSPDTAHSVIETADGGFALVGSTLSFGLGSYDALLVKTDDQGNLEWMRNYGGIGYDRAFSVVQTADGGYALAGRTSSHGAGSDDAWLVKTDANGVAQWMQPYGGIEFENAEALIQTSDYGYVLGGYTDSSGAGSKDFWLIQTEPLITITSPKTLLYESRSIPVYATNITTLDTLWWRYWNTTWSDNQTMLWDDTDQRWEAEGLIWQDGSYLVQVFFNDSSGNEGYAAQRFLVDATPLVVTILSPENTTYCMETVSIYAENTTKPAHSAWWRCWNESSWSMNHTMTWNTFKNRWETENLVWTPGSYQVQVFANDSRGKESSATQWFTVDPFALLAISTDYTFTGNVYVPLVVTSDNILIDGAGYTLQGPNTGTRYGIHLSGASNVTITNVTITGWMFGILIPIPSANITIIDNSITANNYYGILAHSTDTNITRNTISDNQHSGIILSNLTGFLTNNNITGNTISNNTYWGIFIDSALNCRITGNTITNNFWGIDLANSTHVEIKGNTITANRIYLDNVNHSCIMGNTVADTPWGITLDHSSNNTIAGNIIINNDYGVWIYIPPAENNMIYHNDFINNVLSSVYDDYFPAPTPNYWYHPIWLEGNFYSDYPGVDDGSGAGKHAIAGDGIGDTNLPWPSAKYDPYPFMTPVVETTAPDLSSPSNIEYEWATLGHSINWDVGDRHPNRYEVYNNTLLVGAGSWLNGTISWNIDGLARGTYNFTIVVWDIVNNTVTDTVWVTVVDTTPPEVIILRPLSMTYVTTNWIPIYATNTTEPIDVAQCRYKPEFGFWTTNQTMAWNAMESQWELKGLKWNDGTYQVQVFFNDSVGNEGSTTHSFTVDTAPGAILWNYTFGGEGLDGAKAVIQTNDGGFAIAGYLWTGSSNIDDIWLVKTNGDGIVEWAQTFGGDSHDVAYGIIQTPDNGFILVGETYSFGSGPSDAILMKVNPNGDIAWWQTYGGDWYDQARAIIQTSDDGFAIVGSTSNYHDDDDFWLVKLNTAGNVEWSHTWGGDEYDNAYAVVETADGGFAIVGETDSFGAGQTDFWLIKTNSDGIHQWNQTFGYPYSDSALSMIEASDGGFVLVGYTESSDRTFDAWTVKTDSSGIHQWNQTFSGGDYPVLPAVIEPVDGGGYILAGTTDAGENYDFWLMKIDETGNLLWSRTYNGLGTDRCFSIFETTAGGFILAGDSEAVGEEPDMWVLRTAPVVTITSPQSSTTYMTNEVPVFATNATKSVDTSWWRYWNGTWSENQTLAWSAVDECWGTAPLIWDDGNYRVQVFVNDSAGHEFFALHYFSIDTLPPAAITNLAVHNPTSNSLTLTWTAPGNDDMAGTATGYEVRYSTSGPITEEVWESATPYAQTWAPQSAGLSESYTISGLTESTSYWFAIKTYDEGPNYSEISNTAGGVTSTSSDDDGDDDDNGGGGGGGGGDDDGDSKPKAAPPVDTDGDGLTDTEETRYGTDLLQMDTDGDGLTDGEEVITYHTDPTVSDTDMDGLSDQEEVMTYGTNSTSSDTDKDGLIDGEEVLVYYTDPTTPDAEADTDGDGLTNVVEVDIHGTDPLLKDTDGDGLTDGEEVLTYGSSSIRADTDGDGLSDREEVLIYGTNALVEDTDEDGLSDGVEVNEYGTNPLGADTDGDGLSDGAEVTEHGTSPINTDTDEDGLSDKIEVETGTNPLDPQDPPKEVIGLPEFPFKLGLLLVLVLIGLRRRHLSAFF